jgi:alanine racemase
MSRPTRATIHVDALRHNLATVRSLAPYSRVLAVVKADGYGHGLERVAHALEGADAFGVAALSDAERLRAAGLSQRIVLLSGFDEPGDLALMRRLQVESVLHHDEQLRMLEADGEREAAPLRVWLKLDTGMHRLGFAPHRAKELHARLRAMRSIDDDIVLMTHFASSDEFESSSTATQIGAFDAATRGLDGARSLSNSAAVLGFPGAHRDWIRPGGALYGLSPIGGRNGVDVGLEPAMTLSTRLIAINRVARGERIGYGGAYTCPEDMDVGIAAIGYGDGYPRLASSGTDVLVDGVRAPIVGRVSMDLLAIDLRALPSACVGSEVVLWGRGLPIEEVATAAGTIGYELACGITRRVRFVED